jgi:hypothetical protein
MVIIHLEEEGMKAEKERGRLERIEIKAYLLLLVTSTPGRQANKFEMISSDAFLHAQAMGVISLASVTFTDTLQVSKRYYVISIFVLPTPLLRPFHPTPIMHTLAIAAWRPAHATVMG